MLPVRQSIGGLGNLMFKQAYLYAQFRDGNIPDIYLQSPKYWLNYQDEIRQLFSENIPAKNNYISLHIRRGDYVNNSFYVDLTSTDYYQRATTLFPDKDFLVFCKDNQNENVDTRDRRWTIDFMTSLGVPFKMAPKDNSETEDLNLMASCEGHIMANSSFSWWASFLGGGQTVAPKQWFTDGVQRIDLLDNWTVI